LRDVLEKLRNEARVTVIIYFLYVVDTDHELVGVVSLRDLIIASPDVVIQDIMSTRVVSVHDDMYQEDVGHVINKYDLLAVPMLSKQNHLIVIVTMDDVLDILEE